ncbi:MAG: phosphate ABC transporter ATP-binding protein, partial [Planctomycetota bacterium]
MTFATTAPAADAKTVPDCSPGIEHTGGDPIRVRNVDAWYGDFQSLLNLNLDMPVKKVTGLIGPSGC